MNINIQYEEDEQNLECLMDQLYAEGFYETINHDELILHVLRDIFDGLEAHVLLDVEESELLNDWVLEKL